jgi:hypothetical protein
VLPVRAQLVVDADEERQREPRPRLQLCGHGARHEPLQQRQHREPVVDAAREAGKQLRPAETAAGG